MARCAVSRRYHLATALESATSIIESVSKTILTGVSQDGAKLDLVTHVDRSVIIPIIIAPDNSTFEESFLSKKKVIRSLKFHHMMKLCSKLLVNLCAH